MTTAGALESLGSLGVLTALDALAVTALGAVLALAVLLGSLRSGQGGGRGMEEAFAADNGDTALLNAAGRVAVGGSCVVNGFTLKEYDHFRSHPQLPNACVVTGEVGGGLLPDLGACTVANFGTPGVVQGVSTGVVQGFQRCVVTFSPLASQADLAAYDHTMRLRMAASWPEGAPAPAAAAPAAPAPPAAAEPAPSSPAAPTPPPPPDPLPVLLYSDRDFGGTVTLLSKPGFYTLSQLRDPYLNSGTDLSLYKALPYYADYRASKPYNNDSLSSIRISAGYGVVLWSDDYFRGDTLTLTGPLDQDYLSQPRGKHGGWNDVMTSIQVFAAKDGPDPPVALWEDANYGGVKVTVPGPGSYHLADLKLGGYKNDSLSSLKVAKGFTVTLFSDDNMQGDSLDIVGPKDVSDLHTDQWPRASGGDFNDEMSSLRVVASG
jgi:hypothetical protein